MILRICSIFCLCQVRLFISKEKSPRQCGFNRGNPEEINTGMFPKLLTWERKWKSSNFCEKSLGKLSGITDGEGRQKKGIWCINIFSLHSGFVSSSSPGGEMRRERREDREAWTISISPFFFFFFFFSAHIYSSESVLSENRRSDKSFLQLHCWNVLWWFNLDR